MQPPALYRGRPSVWERIGFYAAAPAPWIARTRRDLRRLTMSMWVAMAVVFPIYWLAPSTAPRRYLAVTGWLAHTLQWERNTYPPTAAFAVTVSCIGTGMHYIPDVLASLAMAPFLLEPGRTGHWLRRTIS